MSGEGGQPREALAGIKLAIGFNGRPLSAELDITVPAGRVTALAGPNGAGKSTLLRTLARQLKPVSGQVQLGARDVYTMSAGEFARAVAYMPQSLEGDVDLTVAEMVALGRSPHQRFWSWATSPADRQAIDYAVSETGLQDLRQAKFRNLSGGEKQRVMIASALAQEARFILMDEPAAHLDFRHQLDLCNMLRCLSGAGTGILVVLHDLNLIARLSDDLILLGRSPEGRSSVAACGPTGTIMQPDVLQSVYDVPVTVAVDRASGRRLFVPL